MRSLLPKALLAIVVCSISYSAMAQRMTQRDWGQFRIEDYTEAPRFWQRFHVGYSRFFENATMTYSYEGRNAFGKKESEYVFEKMRNKGNFGVCFGAFMPLGKLSKNSRLCLSAEVMINVSQWVKEEVDKVDVKYFGIFKQDKSIKAVFAGKDDMSLPITLDYRTGCDVMLSKDIPTCFAFGFGVKPFRKQGYYYSLLGESFVGVNPIIKAEFGFRAGMCFKFRAMYEMGKTTYISLLRGGGVYDESLILESKRTIILSILVVPTAFSWGKDL